MKNKNENRGGGGLEKLNPRTVETTFCNGIWTEVRRTNILCVYIYKKWQGCGRVIVDLGRVYVDGRIVPVVEKHLVFCLGTENRIATGVVAK